uniref:Uncharacterized protein n=1 Tax=Romanomermis culicivorax TaxID=13658 RepID=A0A915J118_ROMCU
MVLTNVFKAINLTRTFWTGILRRRAVFMNAGDSKMAKYVAEKFDGVDEKFQRTGQAIWHEVIVRPMEWNRVLWTTVLCMLFVGSGGFMAHRSVAEALEDEKRNIESEFQF